MHDVCCIMHHVLSMGIFPRSFRDAVQQNFVNCTKLDVGMNSLVQRAKFLDHTLIPYICIYVYIHTLEKYIVYYIGKHKSMIV